MSAWILSLAKHKNKTQTNKQTNKMSSDETVKFKKWTIILDVVKESQ
jgi:hypothetical protein